MPKNNSKRNREQVGGPITSPVSGAPNDSFVLNTLKTLFKQAIQSTFRSVEIHSKRRYKIKIKLQKIIGNLLDKHRKLYMNGTVI